MANSPNPEVVSENMYNEHGTKVLITNCQSDVYLERARAAKRKVNEESVEPDLYNRWCGGPGGFDILTERLEDN